MDKYLSSFMRRRHGVLSHYRFRNRTVAKQQVSHNLAQLLYLTKTEVKKVWKANEEKIVSAQNNQ